MSPAFPRIMLADDMHTFVSRMSNLRHAYYGDVSPSRIPCDGSCGEAYEKNAVRFQWRQGDLVTLDNMLIAHARDPHVGPRKISSIPQSPR